MSGPVRRGDRPVAGRPTTGDEAASAAPDAAALPCLAPDGATGSRLRVAVVPNARRTGADGLHDGALRVRLNAPPVDGKANEVLVAWLADELGLPRRAVRLTHGQTSRRKQLELDAPPQAVAAWLARVLAG